MGRQCHEILALVGKAAIRRHYERDEIIYAEGDSCDALYILAGGVAKLSKSYGSGSKEAILRLAGPWDVLGHATFGDEVAREVPAEAVTACEVVKVPRIFLERAVRRQPEAALALAALLGTELAQREDWVGCRVSYRAEAKPANLLQLLARRFGQQKGTGAVVLPRLTHDELAQMIGTTRESVTNAVNLLRRRGVLGREGVRGERVVILEPDELAEVGRRPSFDRGLATVGDPHERIRS